MTNGPRFMVWWYTESSIQLSETFTPQTKSSSLMIQWWIINFMHEGFSKKHGSNKIWRFSDRIRDPRTLMSLFFWFGVSTYTWPQVQFSPTPWNDFLYVDSQESVQIMTCSKKRVDICHQDVNIFNISIFFINYLLPFSLPLVYLLVWIKELLQMSSFLYQLLK